MMDDSWERSSLNSVDIRQFPSYNQYICLSNIPSDAQNLSLFLRLTRKASNFVEKVCVSFKILSLTSAGL